MYMECNESGEARGFIRIAATGNSNDVCLSLWDTGVSLVCIIFFLVPYKYCF